MYGENKHTKSKLSINKIIEELEFIIEELKIPSFDNSPHIISKQSELLLSCFSDQIQSDLSKNNTNLFTYTKNGINHFEKFKDQNDFINKRSELKNIKNVELYSGQKMAFVDKKKKSSKKISK